MRTRRRGSWVRRAGWGGDTRLCAWPASSFSKDLCLFLEERFISFHSNCLLGSWACGSAGLCYKGELQPMVQTWLLPHGHECPLPYRTWSGVGVGRLHLCVESDVLPVLKAALAV